MKFLKVLVNALIIGYFFCALLALMIYDLNSHLTFSVLPFLQFSLYLMVVYGLIIVILCIVSFFFIQFFSGRPLKIAVVSPSFLTIGFTSACIISFFLLQQNIRHFTSSLSPEIHALLNHQLVTLAFFAALGLLITFSSLMYKKKVVFLVLYFLFFGLSIAYVVHQRSLYPEVRPSGTVASISPIRISKKLTLIGMEGLNMDLLITFINENKLPNFDFLMENGSWGTLQNFTPNEMLVLDTSFNTGKLPYKHRRFSSWEYSFMHLQPPLQVMPRFIFFRQLTRVGLLSIREVSPPKHVKDIWDIFAANGTPFLKRDWSLYRNDIPITPEAETTFNRIFEDLRFETGEVFGKLKQALCFDIMLEKSVSQERETSLPQLFHFQLPGLNEAKKYFFKYSYPEIFGELDQTDLARYSKVIERYYQYYDQIIGKFLAAKKDDELLVVYSPHGIDMLPMWKRISEWIFGDSNVSGYHEKAPEGVVFFLGNEIASGRNISGMRLIDVAPTLLHYLGLPVGKDMDGVVNSSVFSPEYKSEPVLYISSYEELEFKQ